MAVDPYINETTRHADVILPPTPPLERDHYDLIFHQLAVRNTARWNEAVLPRPADARHDWEIFRGLGFAYTKATFDAKRVRKALPSLATLRLNPRMIVAAGLRTGPYKLSLRKVRKSAGGIDLGPLQPSFPERLRTRNKRIDLVPALLMDDLDRARKALLDRDSEGDGLLLIGRRHLRSNNSWMHNSTRLTKGKPRHQLLMNPGDLSRRELADGQKVRITSASGTVDVEVAATEDMMPGVVSLPHGFGHSKEGTRLSVANKVLGVSANDLTDPALLDDVAGTAALNGVPVTITACP